MKWSLALIKNGRLIQTLIVLINQMIVYPKEHSNIKKRILLIVKILLQPKKDGKRVTRLPCNRFKIQWKIKEKRLSDL